ncbi:MAG: hypothetical protein AB7F31_03895 [Parachlamydiales bacterium]
MSEIPRTDSPSRKSPIIRTASEESLKKDLWVQVEKISQVLKRHPPLITQSDLHNLLEYAAATEVKSPISVEFGLPLHGWTITLMEKGHLFIHLVMGGMLENFGSCGFYPTLEVCNRAVELWLGRVSQGTWTHFPWREVPIEELKNNPYWSQEDQQRMASSFSLASDRCLRSLALLKPDSSEVTEGVKGLISSLIGPKSPAFESLGEKKQVVIELLEINNLEKIGQGLELLQNVPLLTGTPGTLHVGWVEKSWAAELGSTSIEEYPAKKRLEELRSLVIMAIELLSTSAPFIRPSPFIQRGLLLLPGKGEHPPFMIVTHPIPPPQSSVPAPKPQRRRSFIGHGEYPAPKTE